MNAMQVRRAKSTDRDAEKVSLHVRRLHPMADRHGYACTAWKTGQLGFDPAASHGDYCARGHRRCRARRLAPLPPEGPQLMPNLLQAVAGGFILEDGSFGSLELHCETGDDKIVTFPFAADLESMSALSLG